MHQSFPRERNWDKTGYLYVLLYGILWLKIKSFPFDREDYYTSLKRELNSFFTKNPSGAPSYLSRESDGQSNVTNLFVDFLLAKTAIVA